jgi:hypothetical protein
MGYGRRVVVTVLIAVIAATSAVRAQSGGDVWREFARKLDVGADLTIRLNNGQRFRATLVGTRDDALLIQPKTRVPVPLQPVPYDAILSLERRRESGVGAAKAAVIGVASGAAAFVGMLLILLASID